MLWRLAWYRPTLVATGAYHAATVPRWLPRGGLRDHPLRRARPLPPCRAARAAAAARGLHLEPAARARLAARSVGGADRARRCRRPSCTSMPARRSMAAVRRGGRTRWRRCWPAPTRSPRCGVRRLAPVGREALAAVLARRPRHALPRRSRRDLLPRARRGAGDGGAGRGARRWAASASGSSTA